MLSIVRDFVASPFILQLFLEGSAILMLAILTRNDTDGLVSWTGATIGLFFLRDLSAQFLPGLPLALLFSTLAPLTLVGALHWKFDKKPVFIASGITLLYIIALVILPAVGLLPTRIGFIAPLASALTAFAIIRFIPRDSDDATPISTFSSAMIALALILPAILAPLLSSESAIQQRVVVPCSYLFLLAALMDYVHALNQKIITDRDQLSDTIDTLYDFVLQASNSLSGGNQTLDGLMAYVTQTFRDETQADGTMIMMVDDFEDLIAVKAVQGEVDPFFTLPVELPRDAVAIDSWMKELSMPLGEGMIGETAKSGTARFVPVATEDSHIVITPERPVGSLIVTPLLIQDRVMGVLLATRKAGSRPFTDADFDRASLLADFSSLVINNVFAFQEVSEKTDIDTAASIAADIQKTMRPKKIKDLPNASFGFFSTPARGVCGDYVDVIPARKDRVYLVMGDIAGKGVPAGMIMVMIRAIVHLVTNTNKDAATILNWVNRGITGRVDLDHFATLQILIFDPTTGDCEYANAGHRPPLLWKEEDGLVDALDLQSVPIGVEKDANYTSVRFNLKNNDIVVLYTDGVVETINQKGRQYGIKSLTTILHKAHEQSAKEIADKINGDIHAFADSVRQHDDQTLLVVKTKR